MCQVFSATQFPERWAIQKTKTTKPFRARAMWASSVTLNFSSKRNAKQAEGRQQIFAYVSSTQIALEPEQKAQPKKWCFKLLELPWSCCPHWELAQAILCLCSRNPLAHRCINHYRLLSSHTTLSLSLSSDDCLPIDLIPGGSSPPPMRAYLNWLTFITNFKLKSYSEVHMGRGFNIPLWTQFSPQQILTLIFFLSTI